jgi:hypothetical protein
VVHRNSQPACSLCCDNALVVGEHISVPAPASSVECSAWTHLRTRRNTEDQPKQMTPQISAFKPSQMHILYVHVKKNWCLGFQSIT